MLPANLLGTSSLAHLFVMSLNVAKFDLGEVRLKLMQSAVYPFTVCDLPGGPFGDLQGFCVAFFLQWCLLIFVDLLRSICESLQILAFSPPPPLPLGTGL